MTAPLRVVLDTNVVLSALVFSRGRVAPLRDMWRQVRCQPLASAPTAAELMRALRYPKFKLSNEEQEELLADYLPYCETVNMRQLPKVPACRDPHDTPFLQLAVAGKADHLVTGDKDLLSLRRRFAGSIITPDELLAILGKA